VTLKVFFACIGNSGRSQMAEAFARALGGPAVEARSGGSRPQGSLLPEVVAAMAERDISLQGHRSKPIDEEFARKADLIVLMGCGDDACPAFLGKRIEDWELPDPKHASPADVRRIRDDIEARVRDLLARQGVEVAVSGGSGGPEGSVGKLRGLGKPTLGR
jgi:protein-tyrosine-phosphatase